MLDIGGLSPRLPPPVLMGRDSERAWCAHTFSRHRVLAICGLAGIGKTSLLLTAAHEQARRMAGTVAYYVCAEGDGAGDVLTSLLAGARPPAPRATSLRAALDEVLAWARRTPLVLCIDDAHRISDPLLLDVLAHLGAASPSLWLALASRRQIPLPEADIDGAILRLGPLSIESARTVWADLEDRFGPSIVRFDTLDAVRRGSPFALRRAFAGLAGNPAGTEDGVDLTGLTPPQAALLAQICAFDGPVDLDRLAAVIPDRIAALPELLQALLVDMTPARTITVHDLVRATVARSPRPAAVAEHLVCLAFYEGGGNDLVRLRHTVGAERWADAVELLDKLVRPQYGLFPMGAAVETQMLAAFTALEGARVELPLLLRLARLQLAARHGQGRVVLDALREEAAREPAAWAHLGTVELLLGDAVAAETHIRQALAHPSIAGGLIVRAFLLAILLEVLRTQGRVELVHDVLSEFNAIIVQLGPIGASVAQVMVAAISYDQERYEDAAARLASARPCISLFNFVPALQAVHALLERASCAALVRAPSDAPPQAAVTRALFEDVDFLRATLLLFAADGDVLEGNIVDAEARARDAEAIATRGGYCGIRQWAIYTRAECLRMRGLAAAAAELADEALGDPLTAVHRRQRYLLLAVSALSLAQLGRVHEARRRVGSLDDFAHAPVKAARLSILPWLRPAQVESELARAEFALAQLELALAGGHLDQAQHFCEAAGLVRESRWQYLRARLAVLEAELAVRIGNMARAELLLADAEALCAERGYRREHATAALVAVALARLAADVDRATHWAKIAAERAAGISPDIEAVAAKLLDPPASTAQIQVRWEDRWIDRLELMAPRPFRLREPAGVRYLTKRQAAAVTFAADSFGVDALQHTVHVGGTVRSLAKRSGLWCVLAAFLIKPGRVMSPDELARHAWGVTYHAIRHRSRLVVSIKRLRDALGGDAITSVGGGYCLSAHSWAVLEPVNGPADASADRTTRGEGAGEPLQGRG